MGTTDVTLERIFQELIAGNAGLAIAEAETYLAAWPNPQTTEKLNVIKAEYPSYQSALPDILVL